EPGEDIEVFNGAFALDVAGVHHAVADVAGGAADLDALEVGAGRGVVPVEEAGGGGAAGAEFTGGGGVLGGDGQAGAEDGVAEGLGHHAGGPGCVGLDGGVVVAVAEGAVVGGVDELLDHCAGLGAGGEVVERAGGELGAGDGAGEGQDDRER